MRYQQPYGVADPNAGYINGNPAAGIEGSIPPAAAFEQPMREIVNVITYSDYFPTDADLSQLLKSVRRQKLNYALDTGSVNSIIVTLNPALDSYHAGFPLRVLVFATNTGPAVININGLGTRAIKRSDGSDLHAGDMTAGMIANLVDTGAVFQLTNPLIGTAATSNTYTIKIPYCTDSSPVANTILAGFAPAIISVTEGDFISVKVANTNTGPTTITVNSLAPIPIKRDDGTDLEAGDLLALEQILLENHNTYWQVPGLVRSQVMLRPAPALTYLMADAYGMPSQSFGVSIPGGQQVNYLHQVKSTLRTSTWDGTRLTIGAGETGVWSVNCQVHMYLPYSSTYQQLSVGVNNSEWARESAGQYVGGGGFNMSVTAEVLPNVGDYLCGIFYHQTPSGPIATTAGSPLTRFSAFLVSR